MTRPLRFLQVGLGPLGVRIAADVYRRRLGEVVAAVDPAHAGRPLGELVAGAPAVAVVADVEAVTADVDVAIVSTVSDLAACVPSLRALLARAIPIVSTCEELAWPWERHGELAGELAALAERHGVALIGTGVNPGFAMDALPIALTTACNEVRAITIERIQDATIRRLPFQQKIGVGLSVAEFEARAAAGQVRHVGLEESVGMLAAALGLTCDRVTTSIAPVVADAPRVCALGLVPAGMVRGVHQEAHGFAGDHEVITLIFRAAIAEPEPRDRIVVVGEPRIDLTIAGGLHGDIATSAVALNAAVGLVAPGTSPGLHTMNTLPLRGCAPPRVPR